MLTAGEKSQIRNILQMPQWQTVERLVSLICDSIKEESCLTDSEWSTLKTVILNEGQIYGIKRFIKELYNQAQNNE